MDDKNFQLSLGKKFTPKNLFTKIIDFMKHFYVFKKIFQNVLIDLTLTYPEQKSPDNLALYRLKDVFSSLGLTLYCQINVKSTVADSS